MNEMDGARRDDANKVADDSEGIVETNGAGWIA